MIDEHITIFSCENNSDSLECCEHLVHESLPCHLCKLQKQITALTDMYKELSPIIAGYQDHRIRQIDENRKISKRVDDMDDFLKTVMTNVLYIKLVLEKLENQINEFIK